MSVPMTELATAKLSVAEAAFVADVTARVVDHEIDALGSTSGGKFGNRLISGGDLVYLRASAGIGPTRLLLSENAFEKPFSAPCVTASNMQE